MMTGVNLFKSKNIALGNRVSLITTAKYRYEGIVAALNLIEETLSLQSVQFLGAEGRKEDEKVNSVGSVYDSITFWMSKIIELQKLDSRQEINDSAVIKADKMRGKMEMQNSQDQRKAKNNGRIYAKSRQYVYYSRQNPPQSGDMRRVRGQTYPMRNRQNIYDFDKGKGYGNYRNMRPKYLSRKKSDYLYNRPYISQTAEVDCSSPYDFAKANAELAEELSKLQLDNRRMAPISQSGIPAKTTTGESNASGDSSDNVDVAAAVAAVNGGESIRPDGTTTSGSTSTSGQMNSVNGGSSGNGVVGNNTHSDVTIADDGDNTFTREECYEPSKSFFDKISRSSSGPKGIFNRNAHNNGMNGGPDGANMNGGNRFYLSRDKRVNVETFGLMATHRNNFYRRRPSGNFSKDMMVSSTA